MLRYACIACLVSSYVWRSVLNHWNLIRVLSNVISFLYFLLAFSRPSTVLLQWTILLSACNLEVLLLPLLVQPGVLLLLCICRILHVLTRQGVLSFFPCGLVSVSIWFSYVWRYAFWTWCGVRWCACTGPQQPLFQHLCDWRQVSRALCC